MRPGQPKPPRDVMPLCEIPDGMVEVQVDRLMDDYAMRLQSQGIGMDQYMSPPPSYR